MPPSLASWVTPSSVGQLSNKRGTNTSSDAIAPSVVYANSNGDIPSGIRVSAARTKVAGVPTPTPNYVWDTAWTGTPATSAFPVTAALGANSTITYNGRIYVLVPASVTPANNAIGGILSAPVNGGNVGAWRWESPVQVLQTNAFNDYYYVSDSVSPGALTHIFDFLYVLGQNGIYRAQISADGSIGDWRVATLTSAPAGSTMVGCQNIPDPNGNIMGAMIIAYNNANADVHYHQVDYNGVFFGGENPVLGTDFSANTMPARRGYGALHLDPYGFFWYIGGENGSGTPQTTIYVNSTANVFGAVPPTGGAWTTATSVLPAARSRFGFTYWDSPNGALDTYVYVVGGQATSGGAATGTVYRALGSTLRAGGAFTTYTNAMGTATKECAAALSYGVPFPQRPTGTDLAQPPEWITVANNAPFLPSTPAYADTALSQTQPQIALVAIGGSGTTAVQVTNAGTTTRSWNSGAAAALTTTTLGGGSSIAQNADSTVAVTFCLADVSQGGFGLKKLLASMQDGDEVQLGVQFASRLTGDVSPLSYTLIKIGQAPSLSSVLPTAPNNGQPTASVVYTPGAGGDVQDTYEIYVRLSGVTIFDTGVRKGSLNSALLTLAPMLAPSTTYSLNIVVTSRDVPMPGSNAGAASSTSFTTTAFTVPAAPGSFTATPSATAASVALSWGSVASSTYRVYYRRTGSSTWMLLADNVAGTTYTAMDDIAIGVGYDYAVSAVNATPAESAKSSTQTAAIPATSQAWLHIAGNGATYNMPIPVPNPMSVARKIDANTMLPYGQASPITRYGQGDYVALQVKTWLYDATPATLAMLQAIIAQVRAGNVVIYRNTTGGMAVMTFDADQSIDISAPRLREPTIKLTEVADLVGPYVVAGAAQGYQALVAGRKPPLDPSERML